jgi:hypothetical protein
MANDHDNENFLEENFSPERPVELIQTKQTAPIRDGRNVRQRKNTYNQGKY